jgi:hypothetical protein
MRERNAFVWRRQFPTKGDKAIWAQAIRGRMVMNACLPVSAPWRIILKLVVSIMAEP